MKDKLLNFNWLSFAAMLSLVALGTLSIRSAGMARDVIFHGMWVSNLVSAVLGIGIYFVLASVDYRTIIRYASPFAYAASLVFLVAVLVVGSKVYGGKRWLWFFQPSEVAKLAVIMFLAWILPYMNGFRGFCVAALAAGVPAVLILAEPDLGTTLALVPAVVAMMLVASVWRTGLLALLGVGMVAAALLLGAVHEAERPGQSPERRERILKCVPLRPHQVKRVKTFLYPETDPMGSGYNLRQSLIAIGSGGLRGKGFGHGETNRLKFLPQSVSMNDFIFCVYGEETGFVGTMALVSLFGVLCLSGVWSAFRAGDLTGRLLAIGVSTLVFAHTYINIAMSIGLVPITGLPLPFISSGRTFLLVVMSGLGLIQSVNLHREEKERQ